MASWREELESNEKLEGLRVHIAGKSNRTKAAYLYGVKQICDFFEIPYNEFDPEKLDQKMYDRFYKERSEDLKSSSMNLLSNIFNVLSNVYDLDINIRFLKEEDKFSDYVSLKEVQEIINKGDKELAALAAFFFSTGLRPISVIKIKKEELMLHAENPYVKNVYLKGNRYEDIYILYPDMVLPLLKWYMQYKTQTVEDYDKNPYVFVSQRGNNTDSYIYQLIKKASDILRRSVSPKMFRTGLAVHLKRSGVQDAVIQMVLTHKDLQTTVESYAKFSKEDIFREIRMKAQSNEIVSGTGFTSAVPNNSNVQYVQAPQSKEKCPYCNREVDSEMLLCPYCYKEIRRICGNCKRFCSIKWKICPYCGVSFEKKYGITLTREDAEKN